MPDPRRCDRGCHDHGGDREGTCGDPFGLRWTYQRRPRPATTRRSPENRPHAAPRGRQILAWAPGKDGPNLRRTTPKNPVRLTAGEPACSRPIGPLGVISAPRNSRGFPEPRSRESRPTTRRPLEPHRRTAGLRLPTAQRFAVRTRRPFWQELQPEFPGPTASAPRGNFL